MSLKKEEKESPRWDRGLVLDGQGMTVGAFPSEFGSYFSGSDASIFTMLRDSDAARLSEFCAVAPTPSRDPASFAANVATFGLKDRRFGFAVAVKDRVFSGNHTFVYLFERKGTPGRFPDFLVDRMPEKIRGVVSVLNGSDAGAACEPPVSALAAEMKRRAAIDGTESLDRLIRSVVRRPSAYPELCCGTVVPETAVEPRPLSASFSAGAFSAIFSLLVSTVNSSSAGHETTVRIVPRGDAAEVVLGASDPGPLADALRGAGDLPSLAMRLPRCLEKLSLAAYLSSASGIAVDVAEDGTGLSMTVFPDAAPEEFKDLFPTFDPDLIIGELAEIDPE